jgi:hypothetical protein
MSTVGNLKKPREETTDIHKLYKSIACTIKQRKEASEIKKI